jgi:hypothetical protein
MFSVTDINFNYVKYLKLCDIVCMRHTCKSLTKIVVKDGHDDIMKSIIYYNDPILLKYFLDVGYKLPKNYESFIVIEDKLILLKYLHKTFNIELNKDLIDIAYHCDCLDIAMWLHKKGVRSDVTPTTIHGSYFKAKMQHETWKPETTGMAYQLEKLCIRVIVSKGYLNILKHIPYNSLETRQLICYAIIYNRINILEYLYPFDIYEPYYSLAIEKNQLDAIKWLYSKRIILTENMFEEAVKSGNFDVIKWLYNNNCPYNKNACSNTDELYILKWLRERNIPWDYTVVSIAELKGNSTVSKWAKENGCNPDLGTDMFNLFE